MTKMKFKNCLLQALGYKDQIINDVELEKLLDLNWDRSNMFDWDYVDFTEFAVDVAENGLWSAARNLDLNLPNNY